MERRGSRRGGVLVNLAVARSPERRLLLVIGAVLFVDSTFYSVVAPLLPGLAHQLHLSKLSAGLLTASYAIGTLAAALPGGVLAVRAGPKVAVVTGLLLLAASTVAFAAVRNAAALDVARCVEGAGGACSWAGGLAWVVAATPQERRGGSIGQVIAAAIAGALFGPVIGTLATATGRGPAFSVIVLGALLLVAATARLPGVPIRGAQGVPHLFAALRGRRVIVGVWLVVLPALASGTLNVLAPLRLHRFGASAIVVGATFLVAAGLAALIAPAVGRLSDRRGRLLPLRLGLGVTAALLLAFSLPRGVALLALVVVAMIGAIGVFWAPAMAMLSDAADGHGLDQGLAAALMNVAWALGQILGSAAGGAVAKAAGDGVPMLVATGLCTATLVALVPRPATRLFRGSSA